MAKNKNAVAVIGTSVPDALDAIKAELKGLKEISETQYKTGGSGNVQNFPNSIQTETNVEQLVKMYSSVNGRANAYNNAQQALADAVGAGFQCPIFKENGASVEAINEDIALRIKVLAISERKKELENLLDEAKEFMTREDKFSMFQSKLQSRLGLGNAALLPAE